MLTCSQVHKKLRETVDGVSHASRVIPFLPLAVNWRICPPPPLSSVLASYFLLWSMCVYAQLFQSCPTLWDPMDHSPPGSSVHGILQARILERVAVPSSRGSSQPRVRTQVSPALQADSLPAEPQGKPIEGMKLKVKVAQSCPTLCDPMDYTVHGILQARILEGVAYPFSSGSSWPRNRTKVSCIAGRFIREAPVEHND